MNKSDNVAARAAMHKDYETLWYAKEAARSLTERAYKEEDSRFLTVLLGLEILLNRALPPTVKGM